MDTQETAQERLENRLGLLSEDKQRSMLGKYAMVIVAIERAEISHEDALELYETLAIASGYTPEQRQRLLAQVRADRSLHRSLVAAVST